MTRGGTRWIHTQEVVRVRSTSWLSCGRSSACVCAGGGCPQLPRSSLAAVPLLGVGGTALRLPRERLFADAHRHVAVLMVANTSLCSCLGDRQQPIYTGQGRNCL